MQSVAHVKAHFAVTQSITKSISQSISRKLASFQPEMQSCSWPSRSRRSRRGVQFGMHLSDVFYAFSVSFSACVQREHHEEEDQQEIARLQPEPQSCSCPSRSRCLCRGSQLGFHPSDVLRVLCLALITRALARRHLAKSTGAM